MACLLFAPSGAWSSVDVLLIGHILLARITLIPVWISNHMAKEVWDETDHSQTCIIKVLEWTSNFIQNDMINLITSMLELK